MAAQAIEQAKLYELIGSDLDGASRLLDVCTSKWIEIIRLQEEAAGCPLTDGNYRRGVHVGDMILRFLSPGSIRALVLPYNARLSEAFDGLSLHVDHPDSSLLGDYVRLPRVHAFGVGRLSDWPAEPIIDALKDKIVLTVDHNWHHHPWQKQRPTCTPWQECCRRLALFAGKLRVEVSLACRGQTPEETHGLLVQYLEDLRNVSSSN